MTHAVFTPATGSTLAAQDLAYEYDAVGNRVRTVIDGVETEYSANALNQYTQVGNTVYEYDDDGNLTRETTAGQVTEYVYDADNRLVMVSKPDGSVYEYTYDAFGNRVAVSENGVVTEYVIDPVGLGNVVGEYDATGAWQADYTHGLGLVSQKTAAGSYFYDFDALGSTSAITDALGSVVNSYAYLPFGGELEWTETVANDLQFVGQWGVMNEASGLEFMRARYYDAGVGRFVAADPIGVNGGDTSLYGYCHNQPIATTDASGWLDVDELSTLNTAWGAFVKLQSAGAAFAEGDWGAGVYDTIHAGVRLLGRTNPVAKQVGRTWRLYETVSSLCTSVRTHDGLGVLHDSAKLVAMGLAWRGSTPLAKGVGFTALIVDKVTGVWASNVYSIPRYEYDLMTLQAQMRLRELGSQQTTPVRSCDPNDKLGPAGFGDENYIAGEDAVTMPYTIRFENMADATAPAQWIRITDTFDEDLDLNTFELTEFMLGGEIFAIPAGLDSYSARLRRTIEGNDLMIEVEIALDPATRTLSVSFMALDPATGWMPENPLVGLLYPNDATGRGDGHLAYVVQTAADLPSGTEIVNEATIYFDWNEPIDTPPVVNTIDAAGPTSRVELLPDRSPETCTVTWTGQDDTNGSGIVHYDIYVAVDRGPYEVWLDDTTDTAALYVGSPGHTYSFYSVATDNVGHVEEDAGSSEASTYINTLPGLSFDVTEIETSEGTLLNELVRIVDGDTNDAWTVSIDYGDGSDPVVINDAEKELTLPYAYTDNGEYTLTVSVTDLLGSGGTLEIPVTVHNVAPTIDSLTAPTAVAVGDDCTFNAQASDPAGASDPLTYMWDFGDGTTPLSGINLTDVNHTYATPGDYTMKLSVSDDDGGVAETTWEIVAYNANPPEMDVVLGDGSAQRSVIRSFTLSFAQAVKLAEDAVVLETAEGDPVSTMLFTQTANPQGYANQHVVFVLSSEFASAEARLPDGDYILQVAADRVWTAWNINPAGDYVQSFHTFFGDTDGDRDVDTAELFQLRAVYGTILYDPRMDSPFDVQADGHIDEADLARFMQNYNTSLPPLPDALLPSHSGDLNGDGQVGAPDLDIVRANWGQTVSTGDLSQGDANGDGTVDTADLDIVRANWGRGTPTAATRTANTDKASPASTPNFIGPRRASASDAAIASLTHSNPDHGLSDSDLATLVEAAWLREVEGLRSKGRRKGVERGIFQ